MFQYPDIDPVFLQLGPVAIHWYGLTYLAGFAGAWILFRKRARQPDTAFSSEQVDDLIFYGALGVIIGGRVGSMLFYNFDQLLENPLRLFQIWKGGMSFHGGLLGVLVAMYVYARKLGKTFFQATDFIAPMVPIGLGFGRLGNFINNELWGKPTDVPWAVIVNGESRHASQLYEALLEGLALFAILWLFSSKPRPTMAVSGLFLLGYGIFRFSVEFVRIPDAGFGYLALGWVTMGQVLSFPMIIAGVVLIWMAYSRQAQAAATRR